MSGPDPSLAAYSADSIELLLDAAVMSQMTYCDPDTVSGLWRATLQSTVGKGQKSDYLSLLSRVVNEPVHFVDQQSDAQGYGFVYKSQAGHVAVLAFRGTSSLADAVADVQVCLTELKSRSVVVPPGTSVHHGFSCQFARLEEQCDEFLALYGLTDVMCVGHSMGAPIAAIAASVYAQHSVPRLDVSYVGFGQPRPGCPVWAKWFKSFVAWSVSVKGRGLGF